MRINARPGGHRASAAIAFTLAAALGQAHAAAAAAEQDAFSLTLQRVGIDAYSAAAERADSASSDALLDDDILFAGGDGAVQRGKKRDLKDAVSLELESRPAALRGTVARADRTALHRFVDSRLIAVDEAGHRIGLCR